jgi:hypothetical protein
MLQFKGPSRQSVSFLQQMTTFQWVALYPEYLGSILDSGGLLKPLEDIKLGRGGSERNYEKWEIKIHCIKTVKELIKHIKMWPLFVGSKYLLLLFYIRQ